MPLRAGIDQIVNRHQILAVGWHGEVDQRIAAKIVVAAIDLFASPVVQHQHGVERRIDAMGRKIQNQSPAGLSREAEAINVGRRIHPSLSHIANRDLGCLGRVIVRLHLDRLRLRSDNKRMRARHAVSADGPHLVDTRLDLGGDRDAKSLLPGLPTAGTIGSGSFSLGRWLGRLFGDHFRGDARRGKMQTGQALEESTADLEVDRCAPLAAGRKDRLHSNRRQISLGGRDGERPRTKDREQQTAQCETGKPEQPGSLAEHGDHRVGGAGWR